jgi:hypothetical protein
MCGEEKTILFNAFAPDKEDSVEGEDHYWSDTHGVCVCVGVFLCVYVCVCVSVRECVSVSVWGKGTRALRWTTASI